jgi:uncharacterized membrane protein YbhN (UPF0104 family)
LLADLAWLLHRVAGAQWWALAAALGCHAGAVALHSLAWRAILAHEYGDTNVRRRDVFAGYAAGSALNAFTPARAGVLLKLVIVKTRVRGATYATVAATLAALAAFDALVTIVIVGVAIRTSPLLDTGTLAAHHALAGPALLVIAGTVVVAAGLLVLLGIFVHRRLRCLGSEVARGIRVLGEPRYYLTRVLPVQALNWAAQLAALGFFLTAFHLPATPGTILLAQAAKSLALLVPVTPSGAGTQFGLLMLAFGRGFPPATITGLAVGMRVATTTFSLAVGTTAILLTFRTLRWRRVLREEGPLPAEGPRALTRAPVTALARAAASAPGAAGPQARTRAA